MSLRGEKRRSNPYVILKEEIGTPPSVSRDDKSEIMNHLQAAG
jgi:hypothetical protein